MGDVGASVLARSAQGDAGTGLTEMGSGVRAGGRSVWRVRYGMGEKGGETVPVIDIREYVEPARAEDSRTVGAGRRAGSARRTKEPFSGWTRSGVRLEVPRAVELAAAILEAAGELE